MCYEKKAHNLTVSTSIINAMFENLKWFSRSKIASATLMLIMLVVN